MKDKISDPWVMVEKNLGIVAAVINEFFEVDESRVGLEFDDLYQEGCIWLYKAALTFDSSKGRFSTYSYRVVFNGLKMYCKKLNRKNELTFLPFEDIDFSEEDSLIFVSSEEFLQDYIVMTEIIEWLDNLKSEYTGIAKLGIEAIQWKVKGLNGSDIARKYGVKPNNVGAWISKSLQKLRKNPIFNIYIEDFKNTL